MTPAFPPLIGLVLNNLDEGVMLLDRGDRISLWNEAYLDMLDLPATLFGRGDPVMSVIRTLAERGDYGPGDPALLAEQIAASVRARQPAQGERQMKNGRIIAAEWIPLPDGYLLMRLRNVTSERMASRFKDEMIATVSHELRTPLTVVSGALALLRSGAAGAVDPGPAELINVAWKNSDRLTRLVNDLLDIDKLQSGASDFHFEPADLAELVTAAATENHIYAEALGIAIELELPAAPVIAEVDSGRLMQVMSNLLSNAAKFSPAGSRVWVRLRPGTSDLRISVIDKGRGMSRQFRRRLFTRFAQENRESEHGQSGTGLGLAICKSIVERHHGQIQVDSREGVGTIVHVDLPYRQPAPASEE